MMQESVTSSGVLAASAIIAGSSTVKQASRIHSFIITPAAAISTLNLYDGKDNTGRKVAAISVPANSISLCIDLSNPIHCLNGIYAELSGASASYSVNYSLS